MNEPYDDDDGYPEDHYDYDDMNHLNNPYKFYFKFDVGNTPLSDWIKNTIDDIMKDHFGINGDSFAYKMFPVNSWNPNTGKDNTYQYLGSNYQGSEIWKKIYFVLDPIQVEYKLHIQQHAKHFIEQPLYYKGMFDILN